MITKIADKVILFLCSTVLYCLILNPFKILLPFITALLISGLCLYFKEKSIHLLFYLIYIILCFFLPIFFLFLPVILYDLLFTEYQYSLFTAVIAIGFRIKDLPISLWSILFLLISIVIYTKFKTASFFKLKEEYSISEEKASELLQVTMEKNQHILENQDYELNVAILNERNRISKEIHDHIGHLLSRSLLQIGALLTISKEPLVKEELTNLKHSISEGMDSIRASIHNMHDESIDLKHILLGIVKDFTFCPISYSYELKTTPLLKIKYCFIAITKEALVNISKHSDASNVTLVLAETPQSYYFQISDNGTVDDRTQVMLRRYRINGSFTDGMGLQNMVDRVNGFKGKITITGENGFTITISIPKEGD